VPEPTLDRRQALKILGVSTVASSLSAPALALHRLVPPPEEGGAWKPRFLTETECATVEELVELIIPATDTPGARATLVHQYVDWKLADADDDETRDTVRRGLRWLDETSSERSGTPFRAAPPEVRVALLESIAADSSDVDPLGGELFRYLKRRTVEGYYRSEIGMMQELGYAGNDYLDRFEGCTHDEHLTWEPASAASPDEEG
jgi:hypothetical protein